MIAYFHFSRPRKYQIKPHLCQAGMGQSEKHTLTNEKPLIRGLGLKEATAINMIDMVGMGPFIIIPFVINRMHGPQCILAWLLGAFLAFMDGSVWAELGASYPVAGGSYVFLQKIYGEKRWGSLFAFLFIWQTSIQAPLVIASGAIGFAHYFNYLIPLSSIGQRAVSGGLILFLVFLLYRKISDVGKISLVMGLVVGLTLLWVIIAGFTHFHASYILDVPSDSFKLSPIFFTGLGLASTKTIYSFLGYYNVCHLGAEIRDPEKNIPRSIFISISVITIIYLLMQVSVLGAMPWQESEKSTYFISTLFEKLYGVIAANIVTILILFVGIASLFSATLGYSRIPYAAAIQGNFFKLFARIHPSRQFPHISLLFLCGVAFLFSLFSDLSTIITVIVIMRIPVQFVGQAAGLIALRYRNKKSPRPYRMFLFPVPAVISIFIWLFVMFSMEWKVFAMAFGVVTIGLILFLIRAKNNRTFPFGEKEQSVVNQP
jgi:fructoselysine transporter